MNKQVSPTELFFQVVLLFWIGMFNLLGGWDAQAVYLKGRHGWWTFGFPYTRSIRSDSRQVQGLPEGWKDPDFPANKESLGPGLARQRAPQTQRM